MMRLCVFEHGESRFHFGVLTGGNVEAGGRREEEMVSDEKIKEAVNPRLHLD